MGFFCCCVDKVARKIKKLNKLLKKIDKKIVNIDKEIIDSIKMQNFLNKEKIEYDLIKTKYENSIRELKLKV